MEKKKKKKSAVNPNIWRFVVEGFQMESAFHLVMISIRRSEFFNS